MKMNESALCRIAPCRTGESGRSIMVFYCFVLETLGLGPESGACMETCLSGRKGHPAKVLTAQAVQEFESPRLRLMTGDR